MAPPRQRGSSELSIPRRGQRGSRREASARDLAILYTALARSCPHAWAAKWGWESELGPRCSDAHADPEGLAIPFRPSRRRGIATWHGRPCRACRTAGPWKQYHSAGKGAPAAKVPDDVQKAPRIKSNVPKEKADCQEQAGPGADLAQEPQMRISGGCRSNPLCLSRVERSLGEFVGPAEENPTRLSCP